jgi:hypothetical protein
MKARVLPRANTFSQDPNCCTHAAPAPLLTFLFVILTLITLWLAMRVWPMWHTTTPKA